VLVLALAFSLFFALQIPPQSQAYPSYMDKGIADSLSAMTNGNATGAIGVLSDQDAVRFYLPSAGLVNQTELEDYLIGNGPAPTGSELILTVSQLDSLSSADNGFETFGAVGNFTDTTGTEYAEFASPTSGRIITRVLSANGTLTLKDGTLMDSAGDYYGTVPLDRMVFLSPSLSPFSKDNRLIMLAEDTAPPPFVQMYSGSLQGVTQIGQYEDATVFKIQ